MRISFLRYLFLLMLIFLFSQIATATDFDPVLHPKAQTYQEYLDQWHTPDLGALVTIQFADETRQAPVCDHYLGDSTIWTGMYLASQAYRYQVTGDPDARTEVIRIAHYLHQLMDITDTLGYIGRYAAHDEMPFNCNIAPDDSWKVYGTGEWEGYFWLDHTSRDQYSGWWLGLSAAYVAVDDEEMRATIRQDFKDVIQMLEENRWNITDENGEWTGNGAAWVGPLMRLSWLTQAAYVIDEPYYWELLDKQYELNKPFLPIDIWSWLNKYEEYFGNNLRHNAFLPLFRFWPDRERLQDLWDMFEKFNRPYVAHTLNPWFDSVYVAGCLRLNNCDETEVSSIIEDTQRTLELYWEPPSWKREVTCSEIPLDPFSVAAHEWLQGIPWLEGIINIDPQTLAPREINDRHWTDIYWQSTPFEASCYSPPDPTFEGPGMDYLLAYYVNVYYGVLEGDGPYGDDDPVDDDTTPDDDTTADDDTIPDDDTADDDFANDDISDDDLTDDDSADDDQANDDAVADDDDDNDNDDNSGGCGC